jgi:hypothetical protein
VEGGAVSVSEDRAEKAIRYLSETDVEFAQRETLFNALERLRVSVKGAAFESMKGTDKQKESAAFNSPEYRGHLKNIQTAEGEYLEMRYKRETEKLVWEHWRSVNANRRAGG